MTDPEVRIPPANSPLADQVGECPATAFLLIGGQRRGVIRCALHAGHDADRWVDEWGTILDADGYAAHNREGGDSLPRVAPSPHSVTLEWDDPHGEVEGGDWPERYDADETFDTPVEVPADGEPH